MSKFDEIMRDELDPEDLNQTPRGGQRGRISPTPSGGAGCPLRLLELAGFGGVVVATLAAALVGRCRR
jgi:hypothetical protein